MPRDVDHDQRRRQIAEAVWRLSARGGLEAVTLRQVATEAGVSARLLQYYFGTRRQLLLGALEILNADAEQRAQERIAPLIESGTRRAVLRAVLLELLPLDEERRTRHLVYAVYFVRFLTDPDLQAVAGKATPAIEALVAALLLEAHQARETRTALHVDREASLLVAMAEGLQAQVLLEQVTPGEAVALLDHHLDRILPAIDA